MDLRAALAIPNSFLVKRLEKPPKNPEIPMAFTDSPGVTPDDSTHGCDTALGISGHLPGQHLGLGRKRGSTSIFKCW